MGSDVNASALLPRATIHDKVTRENASFYLSNMLEYTNTNQTLNFGDKNKISKDKIKNDKFKFDNTYTENSIKRMVAIGVIKGYEDNTFRPLGNITRAEFVFIVQNILDEYNNDKEVIHDNLYVNFNYWYWQQEKELFNIVNNERTKVGVPSLIFDENLVAIANIRSIDYTINNYSWNGSHNAPVFKLPSNTSTDFGIDFFNWYGENLVLRSSTTGEELNRFWIDSDGHRRSMLSDQYTHFGCSTNIYYGSELFARQN